MVTNSTLSGNHATNGSGGGIYNSSYNNSSSGATLSNTIVALNTATTSGSDLANRITSGGHNLIGNTVGSTGIANGANGDIVSNTPLLSSLGSNGGPTQTIPLLIGSPAIGAGDATVCAMTSGTAPVGGKDQRGVLRQRRVCSVGVQQAQPAIPDPLPRPHPPRRTGGRPT